MSSGLLVVPNIRLKTKGDRVFAVRAPKLWIELPNGLVRCLQVKPWFTSYQELYSQNYTLTD